MGSLSPIPALAKSPTNRVADDANAALLGRQLFYDKRMSSNGEVACATCHQPELYFTDGRKLSKGVGDTARTAPTIMGSQWLPFVFWDGRKDSLWAQAHGPLETPVEHGFTRNGVAHHITKFYRVPYEAVFGALPDLSDMRRFPQHARPVPAESTNAQHIAWTAMTPADQHTINTIFANAGKAIEAFERKLVPQEAPFDRYVSAARAGKPEPTKEFSAAARDGLRAFIGVGGCVNCHNGPLFTDKGFHNLGLPKPGDKASIDGGRTLGADQVKKDAFSCGGRYSDTQPGDANNCAELRFLNPLFEDFMGAFKTPTLRNVARTAPYMHAGHFATLQDVLQFYTDLPGKAEIGHRDLVLRQIDPAVDKDALIAFLGTLTGPLPDKKWLTDN